MSSEICNLSPKWLSSSHCKFSSFSVATILGAKRTVLCSDLGLGLGCQPQLGDAAVVVDGLVRDSVLALLGGDGGWAHGRGGRWRGAMDGHPCCSPTAHLQL